jgi:two-component system chemotaxis response regulator CheY
MSYRDKILIVDDVALMRDLLKGVLREFGYNDLHDASCGEEALALVQRERYAIVMLDINMPGVSGMKTLQGIRDTNDETFVVMVSAHSSVENVKQAIENGVDGFIVKPYTQKKVGEMLEKYRRQLSVENVG